MQNKNIAATSKINMDIIIESTPPKITIGMPAYNCEKFISESINSLLTQSFIDFELIISDDASTDATEAICRRYAAVDSRVKYFRQEENLGAARNFKFVIEQALGNYFMFASNDDIWSPNWMSALMASIKSSSDCASFGGVVYINESGCKLNSTANNIHFQFNQTRYFRRIKFIFTPHLTGKMILLYSLFPRRVLQEHCDKVNEITGNNSQDLHFVFFLLSRLKFIPANGALLFKRVHPHSDSASCRSNQIKTETGSSLLRNSNGGPTFAGKLWAILFPTTQLARYCAQLSSREIVFMLVTTPIFFLYHLSYSVWLMLNKKVKDVI